MQIIDKKIELLTTSVEKLFNQTDEEFLSTIAGLKEENIQNVLAFKEWDWFQGVGLYGLLKSYQLTNDTVYLDFLVNYYEKHLKKGFPSKNINSVAPMLALTYIDKLTCKDEYHKEIKNWADFLMCGLPKTNEGGFQHITSESLNEGQLWDDTLFMAVLFLARAGVLLNNEEYIEEAKYQFLVHIKYLIDRQTGLWYHGFTFKENHNYAKALWARGNCWITIAIPEIIDILQLKNCAVKRFLTETLVRQIEALKTYQDKSGLWYTIINQNDNYLETSGSAGFCYGILRAVSLNLIDKSYLDIALKPYENMLELINEDGIVEGVSIGTPLGLDLEFYKTIKTAPMAYGQSLMLLYLLEIKKFNK